MKRRKRLTARKGLTRRTELSRKPKAGQGRTPGKRRGGEPSAETKAMAYARDLGCCVRCGHPVGDAPNFHHRQRRSQLGMHDLQNILTTCGTGTTGCHGWIHHHVVEAEQLGYLIRSGNGPQCDPLRVPVLYATPAGPRRFFLTEDGARVVESPEEATAA